MFKGGLQLLTTAQPALAPFSAWRRPDPGDRSGTARRVQAVDLGLDFSQVARGPGWPRLYIACDPGDDHTVWDWQDWASTRRRPPGQHRRPDLLIPYNYLVVSVSATRDHDRPQLAAPPRLPR